MTIVALMVLWSRVLLKHGFYTQVTRGKVTNVTTNDSLRQDEKQVTPGKMVRVNSTPAKSSEEKYNSTKVSQSESIPMSRIILSKHHVPVTEAILREYF